MKLNLNRVKRLLKPSWAEREFWKAMGLWRYVFWLRRETKFKDGRFVFYVDFTTTWMGKRVAIEVDGKQHTDVITQWEVDQRRDDYLTKHKWSVVRIEASALRQDPRRVRREVVGFILHTAPRFRKPKRKRISKST